MGSLPVDLPLPGDRGTSQYTNKNIFIVHGRDERSKLSLSNFLYRIGMKPIILHEQPNKGRTLIEKFEQHANLARYAFVLLTPDDVGGETREYLKPRARQNVILELGFFMGALGRDRVSCIYREGIEIPSDIYGVAYLPYRQIIDECFTDIMTELGHAGYSVNL